MTIFDFIKANGCTCFEADVDPNALSFVLPDGRRCTIHPGIACHTSIHLVRGAGARPRVARLRRRWLRARRRVMRRTGRPPTNKCMTYVFCKGCGAKAETTEHLDGALL